MVRILARGAVALALQLTWAAGVDAQTLTVSGNPQALVISTAIAGAAPDPAEDQGTTYSVSTGAISRIEAHLEAALPPGVGLWVNLEPPLGAIGAGWVQLTSTPQVVVSSILPGTYSGRGIRYRLTATVQAGVVSLNSRQVTFTVKAGT